MTEHIQVVPDKCRACRRCEVACIAAHHGMSFKEAMKHRDELVSRVQVVKAEGFKTTVRCHQCDHAPCANVCPTGALQQDADVILLDGIGNEREAGLLFAAVRRGQFVILAEKEDSVTAALLHLVQCGGSTSGSQILLESLAQGLAGAMAQKLLRLRHRLLPLLWLPKLCGLRRW